MNTGLPRRRPALATWSEVCDHCGYQRQVAMHHASDAIQHLAILLRCSRRPLTEQAHQLAEVAAERRHLGIRGDQGREVFVSRVSARQSWYACDQA